MGLEDLLAGGEKKQTIKKSKAKTKVKETMSSSEEKEYKNIYLSKSAIKLLDQITFMEKVNNRNYTFGDAIYDALLLLAKKKGVSDV